MVLKDRIATRLTWGRPFLRVNLPTFPSTKKGGGPINVINLTKQFRFPKQLTLDFTMFTVKMHICPPCTKLHESKGVKLKTVDIYFLCSHIYIREISAPQKTCVVCHSATFNLVTRVRLP